MLLLRAAVSLLVATEEDSMRSSNGNGSRDDFSFSFFVHHFEGATMNKSLKIPYCSSEISIRLDHHSRKVGYVHRYGESRELYFSKYH
jgi:hypothetical protein